MNPTKRWLNLATTLTLLLLVSIGLPAQAADYNGNCADVPASVNGNIIISESATCNIDRDITATGFITITTTNGAITTKKLTTTNGYIYLNPNNGDLTTDAIKAGGGNNVVITAYANIQINGDIDVSDSAATFAGSLDITSFSQSQFVVGSQGAGHGVNGKILANTVAGGSPTRFQGGCRIYNPGGIKIANAGDIQVTATQSRNGVIILDAAAGNITLPPDSASAKALSLDGSSGQSAGTLVLKANQIIANLGNTTISASDDGSKQLPHNLYLATQTLKSSDNTGDTLNINANGSKGSLILLPSPGISESSSATPINDEFFVSFPNGTGGTPGSLTITGNGEIKATANGDSSFASVAASSLSFQQTNVFSLTTNGSGNLIFMGNTNGLGDISYPGGRVIVTANGNKNQPNLIWVKGSQAQVPATGVTLRSNGAGTNSKNGGNITVELSGASELNKFNIFADGGPNGGNAGTISLIVPDGNVTIPGTISANSQGQGNGGLIRVTADKIILKSQANVSASAKLKGEAGTVTINAKTDISLTAQTVIQANRTDISTPSTQDNIALKSDGTIAIKGTSILDASAQGQQGEGGRISLIGKGITIAGQNNAFKADGIGINRGGRIVIQDDSNSTTPLSIGSTTGTPITFSAIGGTVGGKGGDLNFVTTARPLRIVNANVFLVTAGTNGDGGSLSFKAFGLQLGQNNTLKADGNGSGKGGLLRIEDNSTNTTPLTFGNAANNVLSAKAGNSGDGGRLEIVTTGRPLRILNSNVLIATSGSTGDGGFILLDAGTSKLTLDTNLTANGDQDNGNGGTISLSADGINLPNTANITLAANGYGSGNGGNLFLNTHQQGITVDSGNKQLKLEAKAGDAGDGDGGSIDIKSEAEVNIDAASLDVSASRNGSSKGGKINVLTTSNITVTGALNANGGCNLGKGGSVSLSGIDVTTETIEASSGDSDLCLAVASNLNSKLDAPAGPGDGGKIFIDAKHKWLYITPLTPLVTRAKAGEPGEIIIDNGTPLDLSNAKAPLFVATGENDGPGGKVSIKNVKPIPGPLPNSPNVKFEVLRYVLVNPGINAKPTVPAGEISINDTICRQHLMSTDHWPRTIWDCISATEDLSSQAHQVYLVASRPKVLANQAKLDEKKTQLFVFSKAENYNSFYRDNLELNAGGVTFPTPLDDRITVNVFLNGSIGYNAVSVPFLNKMLDEVANHELGHAIDLIYNLISSKNQIFITDYLRDIKTLNETSPGIKRDPCITPPLGPKAPFDGVKDIKTGLTVCVNGVLNNSILDLEIDGVTIPGTGDWGNAENMQVLLTLDQLFSNSHEAHAHTFAFSDVAPQGARPVTDQVLSNGYFPCTKTWAIAEQSAAPLPTIQCTISP